MIHGQVTWLTQELEAVKTQNALLQRDLARTLSTSAGKDEAKSADPPEFHGDQKEVEGWIMACRLRFATQPSKFNTEDKKTLHATSFLRGPPRAWIQPLANAYLLGREEPPAEFLDFEVFVRSLKALYGDPNLERNSMAVLAHLKQHSSVAEYISRFATHSQHTKVNDPGLAKYFYDGLKGTIKDELATRDWVTLKELQALSTRLDARLQERRAEKEREGYRQRDGSGSTFRKADGGGGSTLRPAFVPAAKAIPVVVPRTLRQPATPVPAPDGTTPMELDTQGRRNWRLDDAEKEKYMRMGLCFRCRGQGHMSADCPTRNGARAAGYEVQLALSENGEAQE